MIEDGAFDRGSVTTVQRVGDTIRRPVGPQTPAVHALLRHLEAVGFAGVPRVLGFDAQGREVLSLLPGTVARRPWPPVLRDERGLVALARFLRAYHHAIKGFVPPVDAQWYVPGAVWQPGQIIRHGDLGPWNSVWEGNTLVGLIDWDFAEPGYPVEDVAQLAWYTVPLRGDDHFRLAGFGSKPDTRGRLHLLCDAYGTAPSAVLDALDALQAEEIRRTTEYGGRGIAPWAAFLAQGDAAKIGAEAAWLAAQRLRLCD